MTISIRSIAKWVVSVKGRRTDNAAKRHGLPLDKLQDEVDRLRRAARLERTKVAARSRPKREPSQTVKAADWVYGAPAATVARATEMFYVSRQTIEREMTRRARLAVAWLDPVEERTIMEAAVRFRVPELWVKRAWKRHKKARGWYLG